VLRRHGPELDRMRADVAEGHDWLAGQLVALRREWRPLPSRANFLTVDVGEADRAAALIAHLPPPRDRRPRARPTGVRRARPGHRGADRRVALGGGRRRRVRLGGLVSSVSPILETKIGYPDLDRARALLVRDGAIGPHILEQHDTYFCVPRGWLNFAAAS
jgi:hypothetical protein